MPLELIVFDLAGTTVYDNRDVHRVLQHALATEGVAISVDDANQVMGIPKPVAIEKLLLKRYFGRKPISEDWVLHIHERFVTEMTAFYRNHPSVRENEGVTETFMKLKTAGVHVVLDTGFDRATTEPLIQRLGWLEQNLVAGTVTSDEVPRGRPYPDMIFKAMTLTGVTDARHVAKVGDTPSDLIEGIAAGCGWVIGITTGAFTREQLSNERHTHLIERIPDVLEVIDLRVPSFKKDPQP